MAIQYTQEQQQVINLRDRNILVSAAAGSGKTTVLVERIIRLICDEDHPVDIDRILIVTFTNAAAASMREKISNAISKKLEERPDDAHLQRQSTLLHHALITTIHSFCLFLIRNNFNDIGLDPGFRIADEGEIKLLKERVMDEILEECFAQDEDGSFAEFADRFITGNSLNGLSEVLFLLYSHAMSDPFPEEWLMQRKTDYQFHTPEELLQTQWMRFLMDMTKETVRNCRILAQKNIHLCSGDDGPYMYLDAVCEDEKMLQKIENAEDFAQYYDFFQTLSFAKLSSKKDENVDSEKRELVKNRRDEMKSWLISLKKKYYSSPMSIIMDRMRENEKMVTRLCATTLLFHHRFSEEKREKNLIDFSDMEHLALQILLKKEGNCYVPTQTAADYRSHFVEVMVDEYQDSNMVQEWILKAVSGEEEGRFNRFMVGDVKQSIYKFRLACPQIFMEKYETYDPHPSSRQRIDLTKNYRSRKEILDGINRIFCRIMGKDLGGVAYDDKNALYPGAQYPVNSKDPSLYSVELLLQERMENKDSRQIQEAKMIAKRIRQLVGSFPVMDDRTKKLRPASYRDIVILLRTNTGWDEEFRRVFEQNQIPVCVTTKSGYFAANEIRTVMNFLRVMDNPRQDIPLYGTMQSCFGKFCEEELALICAEKKDSLLDAVSDYSRGEDALSEKCRDFLSFLNRYREMVPYEPIHKMLRKLLRETGYLFEIAVLPGGEQRCANVAMLLKKAENFEKTSYSGLFSFVRYMEQIQKYDIDFGEAGTLDENADVVRIMSIHKSKGLEFPICFVAGLSKSFNMSDVKDSLISDVQYGIGLDYVDLSNRVKYGDLRKRVIAEKIRRDNLGEELRVLYVAMTRAKEKLILSGLIDDREKTAKKYKLYAEMTSDEGTELLPLFLRLSSSSYMDWIMKALSMEKDFLQIPDFDIQFMDSSESDAQTLSLELSAFQKRAVLEDFYKQDPDADLKKICDRLKERIHFSYAHEELSGLYVKTTVSELKKASMQRMDMNDEEEYGRMLFPKETLSPVIPRFMQKKECVEISGSMRGSAYHRVMELLDYSALLHKEGINVPKTLQILVDSQKMTPEECAMISPDKITAFLEHPLAIRMARACQCGELYLEQPFVLGIDAKRLLDEFPMEETVLVQGIIDAYFVEDGQIILLDYKTDLVQSPLELIRRYRTQLDYYEEALTRITSMPVKEKLIYSFALGEVIALTS